MSRRLPVPSRAAFSARAAFAVRLLAAAWFSLASQGASNGARAGAAEAQTAPCVAVLQRMRVASGGTAWAHVATVRGDGVLRSSGLRGTAWLAFDPQRGLHAQRDVLPVAGERTTVFDGRETWVRDPSGGVHVLDAPFSRALARTDAFMVRRAYLTRTGAAFVRCRSDVLAGRPAVAVDVTPPGGRPATMFVDGASGLVREVHERLPATTRVTRYDDYREVDGLALPFSIHTATASEPENGDDVAVQAYHVSTVADAHAFLPPKPTPDAGFLGGGATTSVPLAVEGQDSIVWASLNGHPALPFILDTGGHAILTPEAARRLGLRPAGRGVSGGAGAGTIALQYARVRSLRIGAAELRDQPVLVIPYPYWFSERGRKTPLAGILGLELFERFTVRFDYAAGRLTLARPGTLPVRAPSLPIFFQDDLPLVDAAADGVTAPFGIDTGNAGSLVLFRPFLERHGFGARYPGGATAHGRGTGGGNTGTLHVLRRFTIAGTTLRDLTTFFSTMTAGGFSSTTEGGNAGYTVVANFTPTFDYAARRLVLAPRLGPPPATTDRVGMGFFKNEPRAFDVTYVRPGFPAARAGIAPGDRIVAVNGVAADALSRADLFALTRGAEGSRLVLRVRRGNATRTAALVLNAP